MFEIKAEKRGEKVLVFMNIPIIVGNKIVARAVTQPVEHKIIPEDRIPSELSAENAVFSLNIDDARQLARTILAETGAK